VVGRYPLHVSYPNHHAIRPASAISPIMNSNTMRSSAFMYLAAEVQHIAGGQVEPRTQDNANVRMLELKAAEIV
jgi:hypothetical protein